MADTWTATAQNVAYASGKSMLSVFNGGSATRVLRMYKFYHFNSGTAAVTGVLTEMRVNRITASSTGTAVTPVAFDTNNTALEAAVDSRTGATTTVSVLFRKYLYSNDEPTVSGNTMDEFELYVPFALVWAEGYGDSNVQALTARATQGYEIKQQGTSAVGTADYEIIFTNAAS